MTAQRHTRKLVWGIPALWAMVGIVTSWSERAVMALAFRGGVPDAFGVFTSALVHTDVVHLAVNVFAWVALTKVAVHTVGVRWSVLLLTAQVAGVAGDTLTQATSGPLVGGSFLVAAVAGVAVLAPATQRPRWVRPAVAAMFVVETLSLGAGDRVSHGGHIGAFLSGLLLACLWRRKAARCAVPGVG